MSRPHPHTSPRLDRHPRTRAAWSRALFVALVALLVAAVGAGLVAGLCFAFASFLMRSFDTLGAPRAIRVMQAINATILRSSAMGVWIGTVVVGVVAARAARAERVSVRHRVRAAAGAGGGRGRRGRPRRH